MDFESICVTEGEDTEFNPPHIQPAYLSTSYKFNSLQEGMEIFENSKAGDVYSRYGHPNHRSLSLKLSALEASGSDEQLFTLLTNSGMSAIHTLLSGICKTGDSILSSNDLYGGTSDLMNHNLEHAGIQTFSHDLHDMNRAEDLLKDLRPKVLYIESPSNPLLQCYNIADLSKLAKKYGALFIVDNTFCTAYIQQPLKLGADFVIYSTTKYLNGHGNALGGAIIGKDQEFIEGHLLKSMRLNGSTISPFDAWLLGQGLKTLTLRLNKQQSNANELAHFLSGHNKIKRVYYPGLTEHKTHQIAKEQMKGFGAMLSFELKKEPFQFMKRLSLITLAPTLGDVHSLVLHPASMSHRNMPADLKEELGITQNLIRLSVGIESISDIKKDILNALEDN